MECPECKSNKIAMSFIKTWFYCEDCLYTWFTDDDDKHSIYED